MSGPGRMDSKPWSRRWSLLGGMVTGGLPGLNQPVRRLGLGREVAQRKAQRNHIPEEFSLAAPRQSQRGRDRGRASVRRWDSKTRPRLGRDVLDAVS